MDKCIARFQGRAKETTIIPGKLIPIGFKIWVIAQKGYFLQWIWHRKGAGNGPIGVCIPRELGGTKKEGKGGNKTQATIVALLERLPPLKEGRYHVFLDNLFTSKKLLHYLRSRGWGATGIARTNSGVVSELIDIKKMDRRMDNQPWGTLHAIPTQSNQVNQIGWKDNAYTLVQTTVYQGEPSAIVI